GGNVFSDILIRYQDSDDFYWLAIGVSTSEQVFVAIWKSVGGSLTNITGNTNVTGLTLSGQALAFAVAAEGPLLAGKVWDAAENEPVDWQVTATDTEFAAAGLVGVRSFRASGNSNSDLLFSYDDFEVRSTRFTGEVS